MPDLKRIPYAAATEEGQKRIQDSNFLPTVRQNIQISSLIGDHSISFSWKRIKYFNIRKLFQKELGFDQSSNKLFAGRTMTLSIKINYCRTEPNILIKYFQTSFSMEIKQANLKQQS